MNSSTRRGFLTMVGVGAAAAGATVMAPGALASTPRAGAAPQAAAAPVADELPAGASGPLVAYVHDVSTGEVAVMVGGHEVVITDKALVAKLAKAASTASRA